MQLNHTKHSGGAQTDKNEKVFHPLIAFFTIRVKGESRSARRAASHASFS
jgi:hypothetical protein